MSAASTASGTRSSSCGRQAEQIAIWSAPAFRRAGAIPRQNAPQRVRGAFACCGALRAANRSYGRPVAAGGVVAVLGGVLPTTPESMAWFIRHKVVRVVVEKRMVVEHHAPCRVFCQQKQVSLLYPPPCRDCDESGFRDEYNLVVIDCPDRFMRPCRSPVRSENGVWPVLAVSPAHFVYLSCRPCYSSPGMSGSSSGSSSSGSGSTSSYPSTGGGGMGGRARVPTQRGNSGEPMRP